MPSELSDATHEAIWRGIIEGFAGALVASRSAHSPDLRCLYLHDYWTADTSPIVGCRRSTRKRTLTGRSSVRSAYFPP